MGKRYSVSKLTSLLSETYGETRSYLCHSDARRNSLLPMLIEERGPFYFDESDLPEIAAALGIRVPTSTTRPAVQNLGQFDRWLRETVMASTAIKLAGGVSSADASDLAKDMRTTPEFIQRVDKTPTHTSFMMYVRNEFSEAKDFRTRLGVLESEPKMTDADLKTLLATNREKYCAPYDQKLLTGSAVISESGVGFDLEPSKVL